VPVVATVSCTTGPSTGRVAFRWDGHLVAVRTLTSGRALARVPARWATRGTHRLVARYLGTPGIAPSSSIVRARVR
jgi:hypothetical protein